MTGPRVEPQRLTSRVLSGDEWEASQYTRGAPPSDPTKPVGKLARTLTGDEWEQAQQLPGPAVRSMKLPALPTFAPRDVTQTALTAGDQKGTKIGGLHGAILRQVIDPMLENPFTTIATTGALAMPVVGPAVGLYMGAQAAYHIAQYGWQKAAELSLSPEDRKRAEADPERLSGEAAAVQAAMLGLAPLIHVGVKTAKSLDYGAGVMEAGVAGVKGTRLGPEFPHAAAVDASVVDYQALRLAEDQADLKATPLSSLLTDETPVGEPRRVVQKDALAPSVADYAARRLAEDQADLSAARAADAQRVTNAPRRRPQGSPAAYFESPQGAETLGAVAARHGLPDDANPYHPSTGLAEHWDAGHAQATESFKNLSETGFAHVAGDEPSSVLLPAEGAGRGGSTVDAVARAKELVGPEQLRTLADAEWARRGAPDTPESRMAAMEQVAREVTSRESAPLMYHGTNAEFDTHNVDLAARNAGAWYTDGLDAAKEYAKQRVEAQGGEPVIRTARLREGNYLSSAAEVTEDQLSAITRSLQKHGMDVTAITESVAQFRANAGRAPNGVELLASLQNVAGADVVSVLKEAGIDGVVRKSKNGSSYQVLNPERIETVSRNVGREYPDGFAMGGQEGRIPGKGEVPKVARGSDIPVPEGATPETVALANALKPSRFRGHSTDALAEAALDAQTAVEQAQGAVERARIGPLTSEAAVADMENRGVSYSDSPEGTSVTAEKQLAVAKSRLSQIEREFALRGVSGDELAGVMQGAKEARLEREGMQQDQTLADLSDKFNPPEPDQSRRAPLAVVEGTGPVRPRGLSVGVQRKAVVNKLNVTLGDVPEYRAINMADQSDRAVALLESDPALARRVALGEAPAPDGLLPESVFVAVENEAIAQGDVATIRDLATGKLTSEATTMGQRIRALGERDPESPVAAIKEVITVRMGGAKNVPRATEETVASIRAMLKSVDVTHESWVKFVNSLRC